MQDRLKQIKQKVLEELNQVKNRRELESFRAKFLVRKGLLSKLLRKIKDLPERERPAAGRLANQIKTEVSRAFTSKEKSIGGRQEKVKAVDVTAPGKEVGEGHLHPLTRMRYEVEGIFRSMGFETIDGPEAVSDYYNFESLNIPKDHPARDMWDTFYLKAAKAAKAAEATRASKAMLLRTHTSSMQVPYMEKHEPPFRVVAPGRCFRREATDASHEHTFYHVEGFMVDRDVSIGQMKSIFVQLLSLIFKKEVKVRLRPGYFPFVEPGFELDFSCLACGGRGCSVCGQTGWVELLGCGLIHPKVLQYAKIDPKIWNGFAFGLGLDRLVMMRYGIEDIRWFHSGDLRFLEQF